MTPPTSASVRADLEGRTNGLPLQGPARRVAARAVRPRPPQSLDRPLNAKKSLRYW